LQQVGFIGLGLIGGSIAKNIRRVFPDTTIVAFDVERHSLEAAKKEGVVTTIAEKVDHTFAECDYIFLCAPVHFNLEYLSILKDMIQPSCIVTDVGSVKSDIYYAVEKLGMEHCFIGGHPMVGSEKSGYKVANDRLIENAYYFLTPSPNMKQEMVDRFSGFIKQLGALPIIFEPERHDEATASISHIPHIIASGLVNLVREHDDNHGMLKQLAAGGFKDITRIASSSPTVWQHICLSNSDYIQTQLEEFIHELDRLKSAIQQQDQEYLFDYFKSASDYRDSIPNQTGGVIPKVYEIYANIPDVPGELAKVTTLMSIHNISLSNIGIVNNRLYEEEALRMVFRDADSYKEARHILGMNGYELYPEK
jgi:prephenate dehydrogenase